MNRKSKYCLFDCKAIYPIFVKVWRSNEPFFKMSNLHIFFNPYVGSYNKFNHNQGDIIPNTYENKSP